MEYTTVDASNIHSLLVAIGLALKLQRKAIGIQKCLILIQLLWSIAQFRMNDILECVFSCVYLGRDFLNILQMVELFKL